MSVRVAQTVDLEADGETEDRAVTSSSQNVPLASAELSIKPRDGYYVNGSGDQLQVSAAHVASFFFFSGTAHRAASARRTTSWRRSTRKPGQFTFTSSIPGLQPPANTAAQGTFTDATDMTLDATITWQGCTYHVTPTAFSFSLYG